MLWPWQIISKYLSLKFIYKLSFELDFKKILSEFEEMEKAISLPKHWEREHKGGLSGIALYSHDGNSLSLEKISNTGTIPTEIAKYFPYTVLLIEELKKKFDCTTNRVRFLKLEKGENINWHYDWDESIAYGNGRVHIPLKINDYCEGSICHENYQWKPGEVWYGDFSFPHKVSNLGSNDRIHLVVDLNNPKKLFEDHDQFEKEELKRKKFKKLVRYTYKLTHYYPNRYILFNG